MSSKQMPALWLICFALVLVSFSVLFVGCVPHEHMTNSVNHSIHQQNLDNDPVFVESDEVPRYDYQRLRELRALGVNATVQTLHRPSTPNPSVSYTVYDSGDNGSSIPKEPTIPRVWPFEHENREVISEYGPRSGRHHNGIDIRAAVGTPVIATADGVVSFSGNMSGYGQLVVIDHGNGIETVYAHLHSRAIEEGQVVKKHDKIGTLGASGNATTPHVHYEVRLDGEHIDPNFFLPASGGIYLTENE